MSCASVIYAASQYTKQHILALHKLAVKWLYLHGVHACMYITLHVCIVHLYKCTRHIIILYALIYGDNIVQAHADLNGMEHTVCMCIVQAYYYSQCSSAHTWWLSRKWRGNPLGIPPLFPYKLVATSHISCYDTRTIPVLLII